MPKAAEIENIIRNHGLVKLTSSIGYGVEPATNALGSGHVDYQFKNCNLTVGDGLITLNRVADKADDSTFNCVDVITNTNTACLGRVKIPGYVFTADFSGCVFYLYRDDATHVIGVHAHQGLDTIRTTKKYGPFKLFKKKINAEVRKEYGPQEYMAVKAKRMLCRHETRGEMTDEEKDMSRARHFMAFLSCVELDGATTFLYTYAPGEGGNRISRLVHKFEDEF